MHLQNNVFKLAAVSVLFTSAFVSGSAMAVTTGFFATVNTSEFSLPAPSCATSTEVPGSTVAGVGAGTGTTNLFTKNANDTTTVVLTSFDCVLPNSDFSISFGSGKFTLTGANGELIFARYSGKLNPSAPDTNTPPGSYLYNFDASTTFVIEGGTGRYARASGLGTISGTEIVNPITHTSQGILNATGRITY